jgi:hypothetical protein
MGSYQNPELNPPAPAPYVRHSRMVGETFQKHIYLEQALPLFRHACGSQSVLEFLPEFGRQNWVNRKGS